MVAPDPRGPRRLRGGLALRRRHRAHAAAPPPRQPGAHAGALGRGAPRRCRTARAATGRCRARRGRRRGDHPRLQLRPGAHARPAGQGLPLRGGADQLPLPRARALVRAPRALPAAGDPGRLPRDQRRDARGGRSRGGHGRRERWSFDVSLIGSWNRGWRVARALNRVLGEGPVDRTAPAAHLSARRRAARAGRGACRGTARLWRARARSLAGQGGHGQQRGVDPVRERGALAPERAIVGPARARRVGRGPGVVRGHQVAGPISVSTQASMEVGPQATGAGGDRRLRRGSGRGSEGRPTSAFGRRRSRGGPDPRRRASAVGALRRCASSTCPASSRSRSSTSPPATMAVCTREGDEGRPLTCRIFGARRARVRGRGVARASVLDDVGGEAAAGRRPARRVEAAVGPQAVGGRPRHGEGVVGVVVDEQALAAEGEQRRLRRRPRRRAARSGPRSRCAGSGTRGAGARPRRRRSPGGEGRPPPAPSATTGAEVGVARLPEARRPRRRGSRRTAP